MSAVIENIGFNDDKNRGLGFFHNTNKIEGSVFEESWSGSFSAKFRSSQRENNGFDQLGLIVLSIAIHTLVISQFNNLSIAEIPAVSEETPPKVMISLSRPQPKPIVQPKIVPVPPVQKVVPLKPQKPKITPSPVIEQPVITQTVSEPTPAPVAPPVPVLQETAPYAGADYLHNPEPEYPEIAMNRGWEGRVLMKVHVKPDGRPDDISILQSSGQRILDDEAVKTVKKWSFVPAKRGENAIAGWVTVPITFKLS